MPSTVTCLRRFFLTLFACLLLGSAVAAKNHERITEFRSDVVVQPDGALTVTETIKVVATGRQIKRGIIRDFPTTYEGRYGQTIRVGFDVIEVRRDGRPEPFKVERVSNGVRIRIGDKDVFIPKGAHEYVIVYRTTRQLGFFEDFDELYWNVTGSGWDLRDRAGRRYGDPAPRRGGGELGGLHGPAGRTGPGLRAGLQPLRRRHGARHNAHAETRRGLHRRGRLPQGFRRSTHDGR